MIAIASLTDGAALGKDHEPIPSALVISVTGAHQ
jgi:hypothetical protein